MSLFLFTVYFWLSTASVPGEKVVVVLGHVGLDGGVQLSQGQAQLSHLDRVLPDTYLTGYSAAGYLANNFAE